MPLYPDERYGDVTARARRIAGFCDAYGLASRDGLIDLILQRQRSAVETVEEWGRAGRPGFARHFAEGLHLGGLDDMAYLRRHRQELIRMIERTSQAS